MFDFRETDERNIAEKELSILQKYLTMGPEASELVAFYDLKVTEFDAEEAKRNDFDLNKKEEAVPDSDDDEQGGEETADTQSAAPKNALKSAAAAIGLKRAKALTN